MNDKIFFKFLGREFMFTSVLDETYRYTFGMYVVYRYEVIRKPSYFRKLFLGLYIKSDNLF